MTLMNLFKVTKTLTNLLTLNITTNIDTSLGGVLEVTAIPPEDVESASNTLNLFLYHIAEDAYYKNALGQGSDVPNVAKTPMALNLFYILTAHHQVGDVPQFDAETQQKLMGYALKTFHDFPVITDQTQLGGEQILDTDLRGKDNSLQVILRPVLPEDSIAFWGSEDTRTVRLSAYYEVRVVLLEPELPKTMPGIVLNLGTFLVQAGSPHLASSQSLVRFQLSAFNGGTVQQVEASPARVTLDSPLSLIVTHNRFQLFGTNLTIGRSRSLVFKNSIWAKLPPPNGPIEQTVVDLVRNPDWQVGFASNRVEVKLAPTFTHVRADATTVNLPVLPGFYSVFVRSVLEERVINNELKQIVATSNEIGFTVAPRIVGHSAPDASGTIQINLGGEFDSLDPNLPADAIQVVVAGEVYKGVPENLPANSREFFVTNTPSNLIRIKPHFPVVVSDPIAHPFRLIVNGAESAPFWIELTP
jgi:hypothetical protein